MRPLAHVVTLVFFAALAAAQDTYGGYVGRWEWVVLTAYSPLDEFTRDDAGNPDRLTATGTRTAVDPYGLAADPRSLPFGTMIVIPVGYGYLDRSRPDDRAFAVDDVGSIIKRRTRETGVLHLDVRYKDAEDARRFGKKRAFVFIVEGDAPVEVAAAAGAP